jgi:hypothetical protein
MFAITQSFVLAAALLTPVQSQATPNAAIRYFAVIKYTDPPRNVWFGPYLREHIALNVVAAHERKGRTGRVVEK